MRWRAFEGCPERYRPRIYLFFLFFFLSPPFSALPSPPFPPSSPHPFPPPLRSVFFFFFFFFLTTFPILRVHKEINDILKHVEKENIAKGDIVALNVAQGDISGYFFSFFFFFYPSFFFCITSPFLNYLFLLF